MDYLQIFQKINNILQKSQLKFIFNHFEYPFSLHIQFLKIFGNTKILVLSPMGNRHLIYLYRFQCFSTGINIDSFFEHYYTNIRRCCDTCSAQSSLNPSPSFTSQFTTPASCPPRYFWLTFRQHENP